MTKKDIYANSKMFLFSRWLATCYADEHVDGDMKSQHDFGYNSYDSMSVLNRETGYWYMDQIKHFNKVVYPNYIKNGAVKDATEFLNK